MCTISFNNLTSFPSFQIVKMKGDSEETKQVLAAVEAGLKKLHTLDDSITLYEVSNVNCFIDNA